MLYIRGIVCIGIQWTSLSLALFSLSDGWSDGWCVVVWFSIMGHCHARRAAGYHEVTLLDKLIIIVPYDRICIYVCVHRYGGAERGHRTMVRRIALHHSCEWLGRVCFHFDHFFCWKLKKDLVNLQMCVFGSRFCSSGVQGWQSVPNLEGDSGCEWQSLWVLCIYVCRLMHWDQQWMSSD